jgi:GT2 family glycosyltransferase
MTMVTIPIELASLPQAVRQVLQRRWLRLKGLLRPRSPRASVAADGISYCLESPRIGVCRTTGQVSVSGWACAAAGITLIEVYLDGRMLGRIDRGLSRPDVAASYPRLANTAQSGFSGIVDVSGRPPREYVLVVEIHDRAGQMVRIERTVQLIAGRERETPGIIYNIDTPATQPVLSTGMVLLSGWACSSHGIASVEVHRGTELLTRVETGLARPDVEAAHPDLPNAAYSGFTGSVDLTGEPRGEHTLAIVIRDGSGQAERIERTVLLVESELLYQRFFLASLPAPEDEQRIIAQCGSEGRAVGFDLWVVVRQPDPTALNETIGSIVAQAYPYWRVRLVSSQDWVRTWPVPDDRIQLASAHDLTATDVDPPDFVAFLHPGEVLAPGALSRAALFLSSRPALELLYSDHDRVRAGRHVAPAFKPDWSPDHLLARNYVGGLFFARRSTAALALARELLEADVPAWRLHFLLHMTNRPVNVGHLPDVLWSEPFGQEVEDEAELEAVRTAVRRRGWRADVLETAVRGVRRVRWSTDQQPKVTIIIPTTGNPGLLTTCVDSLERTRYPDYEIIFIDNGRGRHPDGIAYLRGRGLNVVECDEAFNWARLNNVGVSASEGELLLFLNDDIEVIDPGWLAELVPLACREDIGCVGAMLVYPDDRIQHAGVFVVNHGGGARHFLRGEHRSRPAYEHLDSVVREVSSNTGACLMVRRELFERLGGFDEALAIVGNDIDLCLRAAAAGYRNLWTPHCVLIHHESVSRKDLDILDDEGRMWERWADILLGGDPYYNGNLSPYSSDCSLNMELLRKRERAGQDAPRRDGTAPGLNLIGFVKAEMGIGQAMRGLAAACESGGVPFDIYSYEHDNPARMGDESWSHRITEEPGQGINLLMVNPDVVQRLRHSLPSRLIEGRYTIGYWVWELPELPEEWTEAFRSMDEVWTPSAFVQQAVALKAPVPVVRIPYVVEMRKHGYLDRDHFGLPGNAFLFLMMYDVNSVRERKNPQGAITAFRKAFAGTDASVGLVIKINNCTERELASIRRQVDGHANIHVIGTTLSRYEVDSLIHCCDAVVSLHRSEGFGLVLAEAMALGRPVIATYWSGNTDFMNPSNSACVDYRLVMLERDHGPYRSGQVWADPDLDHAAWWMRRVREDGELRSRLVKRAANDVQELLSARRIGAMVASRLAYVPLHPAR